MACENKPGRNIATAGTHAAASRHFVQGIVASRILAPGPPVRRQAKKRFLSAEKKKDNNNREDRSGRWLACPLKDILLMRHGLSLVSDV